MNAVVPDERDSLDLLARAFELGIRYFDTAPSYGASEQRVGKFLRSLVTRERDALTIATKFGEQWDADRGEPIVDHSYDALRRSLDRSIEQLGRIDILQLHKTVAQVLRSDDLARAWEYARASGISRLGASVSDLDSAAMVLRDGAYGVIQLPYNREFDRFGPAIDEALSAGKWVAVNRPYAMGKLMHGASSVHPAEAFRFVLDRLKSGVILSGTKSVTHLEENVATFRLAASNIR